MASVDIKEDSAGYIEHAIEEAAKEDFTGVVAQFDEQFVDLGDDLCRAESLGSIGAEVTEEQSHDQGAVDTVADSVADEQRNLVSAQMREIVKVSTDVLGGAVPGSDGGPDAAGTFAG